MFHSRRTGFAGGGQTMQRGMRVGTGGVGRSFAGANSGAMIQGGGMAGRAGRAMVMGGGRAASSGGANMV